MSQQMNTKVRGSRTGRLVQALVLGALLGFPLVACADPATEKPKPQAASLKVPDVSQIKFGPHPRVALSPRAAEKLRSSSTFEARKKEAIARGDKLLANPVPLPNGYGSWSFYYANPETGTDLVPIDTLHHKDPKTGQVFTDERTVAAYRCLMHYALDKAAENLAWAYFYSGDDKYAEGVVRILGFLADEYPNYPKRLDRWGRTGFFAPLGGRRYVQALDEAVSVIQLARAYDLTYGSKVWTDESRKKVESQFFRGTADSLLWFRHEHNHQTWYNAGLVAIACAVGDPKLFHQVLTMDKGVVEQLDRNVGSDGLWAEGTMAYHNYALQALLKTADIADINGVPIKSLPKLKAMITGPLYAAYPNGVFPAINDSDPSSTAALDYAFKWAFENYGDELFAQADARGDEKALKEMLGPDAKVKWPLDLPSANLPDVGLGILRVGAGDQANCVFLDYGKHGIAHGHYDKLNFTLYANGREWVLDPGRLTYSHKEFKTWVKETVAHNTVVVDMKTQAAGEGRLLWLQASPDKNGPMAWAGLQATADTVYSGVKLTRTMALTSGFLLDVFDVQADADRHYDYVVHTRAKSVEPVSNNLSGVKIQKNSAWSENGYQHLTSLRHYLADGPTGWVFTEGKLKLGLTILSRPEEMVTIGSGIGYSVKEMTPTVMWAQSGKRARFVAVYDLSGKADQIKSVKALPEDRYEVTTVEGKTWKFTVSGAGMTVE